MKTEDPGIGNNYIRGGLLIVILFLGFLGLWSFVAPLQSAAIAPGVLTVHSQRKTVQHLEGGIVSRIHVSEGQQVEAGDILIQLDDTQARANLELLAARLFTARAEESRLQAERDGLPEIVFPSSLGHVKAAGLEEILESQRNIFSVRRQSLEGQIAILERRIEQFEEEIKGLSGLAEAENEQLRLLKDEMDSYQTLLDKNLTGKAPLRELQRAEAELLGDRSQNLAAIARSRQGIDEARLQIIEARTRHLNEAVELLRKTQSGIHDLTEQIKAAEDVLRRTEIRSATRGTIVNLQIHSQGGVISPGQSLMEIVPDEDRIIVEARIDPVDIDVVKPGLLAHVRLSAYSYRNILPARGKVVTVSADRLTDGLTHLPYFLARIELEGLAEEDVELYPGMQAEVMIVTGERSLADYLIWPVRQSFRRAFRET